MKKILLIIILNLLWMNNSFAGIDKIKNLDSIKFILNTENTSSSGVDAGSYLCWADNNESNYSPKKIADRICHRSFSHKLYKIEKADKFKKLYKEFLSIANLSKCKGEYSKDPSKNDSLKWNNCLGYIDNGREIIIAPFKEGSYSGLGIRIDGFFSLYIGEFADDYMHGKGLMYMSADTFKDFPVEKRNSIVVEGIWEDDERVQEISRKEFQ